MNYIVIVNKLLNFVYIKHIDTVIKNIRILRF